MLRSLCLAAATACALALPGAADTVRQSNGGDTFIAGSSLSETIDAPNDVFIAGSAVTLKGAGQGDVHAAGFDVDIEAQTGADLYAAGATVTVRAPVGQDLTAMGMSVRTAEAATTGGNARLMGRSVTIDGPVTGALTAMGYDVILNSRITGDAWIIAENITYGPDARIDGTLRYAMRAEAPPPERVIDASRVTFERITPSEAMRGARGAPWEDMEYPMLPTFMTLLAAFIVTVAFFVVVGALFLAFLPKPVERLRRSISDRPGMMLLGGVIGLATLLGLIPITGMTIIGLPFVPIVVLAAIVAWTLGYVLGAYAVGLRVWQAFGASETPSLAGRLLALTLAVVVVAALNFIPFVGWIANYTLVLLGIGAVTNMLFEWMLGNTGPALDVDMQPVDR